MNMWEAIVVIVVVASFARVFRDRYRAEHGYHLDRRGNPLQVGESDPQAAREAADLRREVTELRERIKVLERIATDTARPGALAAEIEALRHD